MHFCIEFIHCNVEHSNVAKQYRVELSCNRLQSEKQISSRIHVWAHWDTNLISEKEKDKINIQMASYHIDVDTQHIWMSC